MFECHCPLASALRVSGSDPPTEAGRPMFFTFVRLKNWSFLTMRITERDKPYNAEEVSADHDGEVCRVNLFVRFVKRPLFVIKQRAGL